MLTLERPLIATINHLLARQPALRERLRAYAGKVARIDLGLASLTMAVAADGLLETADAEPVVTIAVQPANVPLILSDMERAFSYVTIRGDADFARAISELAQQIRWDPEEELAPWIGDIAAVRVARTAQAFATSASSGARKLAENLAEYWLEENPTLMYRRAGDEFAAEVARLRDDVERLGKRIERLQRARADSA